MIPAGVLAVANRYRHVFGSRPAEDRPGTGLAAAAVAPLLGACGRLGGPDRTLEAARLLTAYVHGFASMELADGFGLGGDVDAAFAFGIDTLVGALERGGAPSAERAGGRRPSAARDGSL